MADASNRGTVVNDPRFAVIHKDPRFARAKKSDKKVTVDARFAHVVDDDRFRDAPTARRKRARHEAHEAPSAAVVESLYTPAAPASSATPAPSSSASPHKRPRSASAARETVEQRLARLTAMARGNAIGSDSDSSDADEGDAIEAALNAGTELVLAPGAPNLQEVEYLPDGSETATLALVNVDWDNLKAVDILATVASFTPPGGAVRSVTVYPSSYGLARMETEARLGPVALLGPPVAQGAGVGDAGVEREVDPIRLRAYELDRLKFYYAIIQCDSVGTAVAVYNACDGLELESTSNEMDLRFVPAGTDLNHAPRDAATAVPADYEPPRFATRALGSSNVELTWDGEDPVRARALEWKRLTRSEGEAKRGKRAKRRGGHVLDDDADDADAQLEALRGYIAESESEDDEDDEEVEVEVGSSRPSGDGDDAVSVRTGSTGRASKAERREAERHRLRMLLLGGTASDDEDDEDGMDEEEEAGSTSGSRAGRAKGSDVMQISFTPGLDKKLVKQRKERAAQAEETVFEASRRQIKEKRQKKRAAGEGQRADDEPDALAGDAFFAAPTGAPDAGKQSSKAGSSKKGHRSKDEAAADAREKAELELLTLGDDVGDAAERDSDEGGTHRGRKRKSKKAAKAKREAEAEAAAQFRVDVTDPRFAAATTDPRFAVDKTAPQFKDTPAMRRMLEETTGARGAAGKAPRAMVVATAASSGVDKDANDAAAADAGVHALAATVKAKFSKKARAAADAGGNRLR